MPLVFNVIALQTKVKYHFTISTLMKHYYVFPIAFFISSIMLIPNVFAWHENLAITDQQAAQFFKTKPNDPEIVSWKNLMQQKINLIDNENCEQVVKKPLATHKQKADCVDLAKFVYDNCVSHPDTLLVCFDPKIAHLAGITQANQSSSNSSITQ